MNQERLERDSLLLDLIVTGIPLHRNENVSLLADRMCDIFGFNKGWNGLSGCYRLAKSRKTTNPPNGSNPKASPPIISKFWTFNLKQEFFIRYLAKKSLNLSDIGFQTAARVYINESLTSTNQRILSKCRQLQKNKMIHQCRTYKGQVFVKILENSPNQCIHNMEELLHVETMAQDQNL